MIEARIYEKSSEKDPSVNEVWEYLENGGELPFLVETKVKDGAFHAVLFVYEYEAKNSVIETDNIYYCKYFEMIGSKASVFSSNIRVSKSAAWELYKGKLIIGNKVQNT